VAFSIESLSNSAAPAIPNLRTWPACSFCAAILRSPACRNAISVEQSLSWSLIRDSSPFHSSCAVNNSRSLLLSSSNGCKRSDWVECPRSSRNARRVAVSIKQDEFRETRLPSRAMSRAYAHPLHPMHAYAPTPYLPAFFSKRAACRGLDQTRRISRDSLAFASNVSRLRPPSASNARLRSNTVPTRVLLETRGVSRSRSNKTNFARLACLREQCLALTPTLCIQCTLTLQHRTYPRSSRNARRVVVSIKQDEFRGTRLPSLFQYSSRSDREPRN
jgi:hypothetical protein